MEEPRVYYCQVTHNLEEFLPCKFKGSGGYQCERLDPHTDGHWVGAHTIAHALAGNGYTCESI